jgi:translation initiation factor 2 subunit 2
MQYLELLKEGMKKIKKKNLEESRFKLPNLEIQILGNKTILKNFSQIASAIRRDQKHFAKYLLKELASHGNIQSGQLIFNSRILKESIEKKIHEYLKTYVYCKVCGSPDTKIIKENRILFIVCEACGARSPIKR